MQREVSRMLVTMEFACNKMCAPTHAIGPQTILIIIVTSTTCFIHLRELMPKMQHMRGKERHRNLDLVLPLEIVE